jgi:hypothetical protein
LENHILLQENGGINEEHSIDSKNEKVTLGRPRKHLNNKAFLENRREDNQIL